VGDAPLTATPTRALISHLIPLLSGKQTEVFTINDYHLIKQRRITGNAHVQTGNGLRHQDISATA
jgi:hypothetical protein